VLRHTPSEGGIVEVASAFVSLLPSARGFGSKLDQQVGGETRGAGKRLGVGFGKAFAAGGALIAAAGVGKFLKDSLGEARESQKVAAQTNAVIKSTGGAANVTAASLGKLSGAISRKVGIDDEAIQSAGNLLLTFTGIRNEAGKGNKVFDQTVRAATDMSVALGTDAKSAAMQLGKALNDPVKGVTKLQRSGVTFTDQQKKQIATLVKSGKTLQAQKIILGEVNKEFGGSAAAQATAGDKFKVAFGNLEESIGTALLPVLDKVLGAGTKFATMLTNNIGPGISALNGYLAPAIAAVGDFFSKLSSSGQASGFLTTIKSIGAAVASSFLPLLKQLGSAFTTTLLPVLKSVGAAIATNVLPVLKMMAAMFTATVLPALTRLGSSIITNVLPVIKAMAATFTTTILPAIKSLATYLLVNLVPIFAKVAGIISGQVIPIISTLATFFYGTLYPAVVKIVSAIAVQLKPVFDALFQTIQTSVLPAVSKLLAKFQEWWPTISKVVMIVLKVVGAVLIFAAAILGKVLPPLIRFTGFLLGKVIGAIGAVIGAVVRIVAAIIKIGGAIGTAIGAFNRFATGVDAAIRRALGFVAGIPGKIKAVFSGAGTMLSKIGSQIVDGLKAGISGAWHKVTEVVTGLVNKIPKKIRSIMGIASPSKVTTKIGHQIGEGLIKGLEKQEKALKDKIGNLTDKFNALKQTASDFASGIASKFQGDLFTGGLAELKTQLFTDMGNANAFTSALSAAAKKGLNGGLYAAIAGSGNVKVAQEISALSPQAITQYENLFNAANAAAVRAGQTPANQIYGATLNAQLAEIRGLRADLKADQKQQKITIKTKAKGNPKKAAKQTARVLAFSG
jgi:phage-related protein